MYEISFPPQSNKADFYFAIGISALDTGDDLDLSGMKIVFDICNQDGCQLITFSSDDLIQKDTGIFWWTLPGARLNCLCAGTYPTGCRIIQISDGQTRQLSVGPLPIVEGN